MAFLPRFWYSTQANLSVHSPMSSLADAPDLVGFFSYSREDDEGSGGKLPRLRERIQEELRLQLGRSWKDFRLWQDKAAIAHGELWEDTIKKGISESVFFIPIITPTAVKSPHCKLRAVAKFAAPRCLFERGCPKGRKVLREYMQSIAAKVVIAGRTPAAGRLPTDS